jgi:hypothetical protein
MNRRTQVLIGLAVVALGIGAWAVGLASGSQSVQRVEDLEAAPAKYGSGEHVLLGVPQPPQVPVSAAAGTVLRANPDWSNATASTVRWVDGQGNAWYSTRTVSVALAGETAHWTYRNETRRLPADPQPAVAPVVVNWTTSGGRAFAIEAFHDATQDTPRIWGLYAGLLKDPMQAKPSQFTGHLMTSLPDGRPMPDGAFVYDVQDFKAGCSSKFLPPQEKERLQQSGQL